MICIYTYWCWKNRGGFSGLVMWCNALEKEIGKEGEEG